jgi:hypothetical protein
MPKFLQNFVSESDQWWFVVLLVLMLFSISPIINFHFLNFIKIDYKTATLIVDQRTTNIAAIISITLVVVGFILNNLAVKSPLVYGLLFKKSLLYPIIYLTLSVIGVFIAISTLRDTLSPFVFTRLVLAGTYFSILILILIASLFRKILFFSNEKEIEKMLNEELINEAKENTKRYITEKYSEKIFTSIMQEKGAKEYDWSYSWNHSTQINIAENEDTIQSKKKPKELLVYDLNLETFSNFIENKKDDGTILFKKLSLEKIVNNTDDFVWSENSTNTKQEKTKLLRGLVFKNITKKLKDDYALRKFYDEKFEKLSELDNHRSMEQVLESYLKLYEIQTQIEK